MNELQFGLIVLIFVVVAWNIGKGIGEKKKNKKINDDMWKKYYS